MSRAQELKALAEVLEDPANADKSTEDISQLLIDAIDSTRSKSHRLAVVGQIYPEGASSPLTVVLGPYSSRSFDTPEKFQKVVGSPTSARTEAQNLAWDIKMGSGKGRFMLAPAFMRARQAWDFYRPEADPVKKNPMHLLAPPPPHITESIDRWEAGGWAEAVSYPPACHCGMPDHPRTTSLGDVVELGPCPRHREEKEAS